MVLYKNDREKNYKTIKLLTAVKLKTSLQIMNMNSVWILVFAAVCVVYVRIIEVDFCIHFTHTMCF